MKDTQPSGQRKGSTASETSDPADVRQGRPPAKTQSVKTPQGEGQGGGNPPPPRKPAQG